jgi:hypothetical protein
MAQSIVAVAKADAIGSRRVTHMGILSPELAVIEQRPFTKEKSQSSAHCREQRQDSSDMIARKGVLHRRH